MAATKTNVVNVIPQNSISLLSSKQSVNTIRVKQFSNGSFEFTKFALVQFVEGVQFIPEILNKKSFIDRTIFELYVKCNKALTDSLLTSTNIVALDLTLNELITLKQWLEARMSHCEKEREEGNPAFNIETYIGMKLLLIDIREIMIGEVISD